jgi:hypothetical protein
MPGSEGCCGLGGELIELDCGDALVNTGGDLLCYLDLSTKIKLLSGKEQLRKLPIL